MGVDLQPVEELDLDEEILEFATNPYCASCVHVAVEEEADGTRTAYCTHWEAETKIKPGWVCPEYVPQGFEVD